MSSKSKVEQLINQFMHQMRMEVHPEKIALSLQSGVIFVSLTDIIRIKAEGSYSTFVTQNSRPVTVSKRLKIYEPLLPSFFMRIHNSHIINIHHIKKYIRHEGGYLIMNDSEMIPVSKNRKKELESLLIQKFKGLS